MSKISEERREVAARLRSGIVARNIPEAYVAIVQSIGVRPCLLLHDGESGDRFDRSAYELALSRLADLIDPQERTCHNSAPHYLRFLCSECHYVIYHDDVNEMGEPDEDGIKFCPNCGARVVSSDDKEME